MLGLGRQRVNGSKRRPALAAGLLPLSVSHAARCPGSEPTATRLRFPWGLGANAAAAAPGRAASTASQAGTRSRSLTLADEGRERDRAGLMAPVPRAPRSPRDPGTASGIAVSRLDGGLCSGTCSRRPEWRGARSSAAANRRAVASGRGPDAGRRRPAPVLRGSPTSQMGRAAGLPTAPDQANVALPPSCRELPAGPPSAKCLGAAWQWHVPHGGSRARCKLPQVAPPSLAWPALE